MQNINGVAARPVKDPEWIAHDCGDTDLGALRDAGTASGIRPMRSITLTSRRSID